jgi:hypothetical protein
MTWCRKLCYNQTSSVVNHVCEDIHDVLWVTLLWWLLRIVANGTIQTYLEIFVLHHLHQICIWFRDYDMFTEVSQCTESHLDGNLHLEESSPAADVRKFSLGSSAQVDIVLFLVCPRN